MNFNRLYLIPLLFVLIAGILLASSDSFSGDWELVEEGMEETLSESFAEECASCVSSGARWITGMIEAIGPADPSGFSSVFVFFKSPRSVGCLNWMVPLRI